MNFDPKKALIDIQAAQAFLSRLECQIRSSLGSSVQNATQNAPKPPSTAFLEANKENTHATPSNQIEVLSRASGAISPDLVQYDLFGNSTKLAKKSTKTKNFRKKGSITLSRKQVLDNFHRISASKTILTLADVNQILGFNKCTGSSFVKLAVKRGELGAIPVGREFKFLPIDIRAFIKLYFDRKA